MPNNDEAKRKILLLANRAKKASTTITEESAIVRAIDSGRIKNRTELSRILEEALNKSPAEIGTVLASDDSDRLAKEIVSLLED